MVENKPSCIDHLKSYEPRINHLLAKYKTEWREELKQEIRLVIWQNCERGINTSNLYINNKINDILRDINKTRRKVQPVFEYDIDVLSDYDIEAAVNMLWLRETIDKLPNTARFQCFRLYLTAMQPKDIAKRVGLTSINVNVNIRKVWRMFTC